MFKKVILLLPLVCIILFDGCTTRMIDFTVISSKNVSIKVPDSGRGDRVEGTDYAWWILCIPTGIPNMKEAVDDAIEKAGPGYDALIDGVLYSKFYWYVVTLKNGYLVEGTPIKTTELIAELREKGEDVDKYMERALYHSSLGVDNSKAIEKIGILKNKSH